MALTEVSPRHLPGACAECGYRPGEFGPDRAAAAARSVAMQWRRLLNNTLAAGAPGERLLRVSLAGGWSALDHAARVRDVFERKADRVVAIRDFEDPILDEVRVYAPHASDLALDASELLAGLLAAAERLARVSETLQAEHWRRAGRRDGTTVTVVDLMHEAMHEGTHHLRAASAGLEPLLLEPDGPG